MIKKTEKQILRGYARLALEGRGFVVQKVSGPGLIPGARLKAAKDGKETFVAVRTSHDRKVGLLRQPNGKWRTVPKVQEVVVAVPALDDAMSVEVFGFKSKTLIDAFDSLVTKIEKGKAKKDAYKSPIFIELDAVPDDRVGGLRSNLKAKSSWAMTLPFTREAAGNGVEEQQVGFVERVRQEFADLNGVDVSKVIVNFHIVG